MKIIIKNFISVIFLALIISGCGFQPLHSNQNAALPIKINSIKSIDNQFLKTNLIFKQELEEALNFINEDVPIKYYLDITLSKATFSFATQSNSINSRKRIDLIADYILRDSSNNKVIAQDKVIASDSVEITISPYSNIVSEEEVLNTLARVLADEIKLRLVMEIE